MSNKVGLEVVEGVARGFTSFTEPSKRNIALLMARERGVANKLIPIDSLDKDREIFGDYLEGAYGSVVTRNFFRNVGGFLPVLYGVRIVGSGSAVANGVLNGDGYALDIKAGYEGQEDLGSWGNDLNVVLYNKGFQEEDKWVLEVSLSGTLVEAYSEENLSDILEAVKSSKFVVITTGSNIEESGLTVSEDLGLTVTSPSNDTDITFSGALTGLSSDAEAEGMVLYTSTGIKIGTIASYDSSDNTATLVTNTLVDISGPTTFTLQRNPLFSVNLTGGVYNAPLESDFYGRNDVEGNSLGLSLLEGEDVQIFSNTEFHTKTMAIQGNSFGASNDMLHVCVLPRTGGIAVAKDYASVLRTGSISYTAAYYGWAQTLLEGSNFGYVPSLGFILAAGFVKSTGILGDFIHIPPAGTNSNFVDLVSMDPSSLSQQNIDRYVQDYGINVIRYQRDLGYFILSSRTMSSNALYHSIHVRLQTSFYKRALLENMGFVLQRPNTVSLRRDAYAAVYSYFKKEYTNGALETSVSFEEACEIVIDQSNNPVGQDRKLLNMDINWIPTEATESFKISLNRNDGALLVTELNIN